jgi:hypothetical protein
MKNINLIKNKEKSSMNRNIYSVIGSGTVDFGGVNASSKGVSSLHRVHLKYTVLKNEIVC